MTIDFRLLGAVELRHRDGQDIRSVLAQPRRLALLAYLTLRSARGPERRDTLLGVFWPESDEAHARGALRNAIHFLRRSLGAETITSRSDEELLIDLDSVHCDAVEFERFLEAGREAEALELYRGDLLEGFFISEAIEFERWLESERGRLCHRAVAAATRLAEEAEAARHHGLAVHYVRHALALSRDDEVVARRLISLLASAGDRTGALRSYEEFAARIAAAYGVEPSAETRALVEELRRSVPPASGEGHPSPGPQAQMEEDQGPTRTAEGPRGLPLHADSDQRAPPLHADSDQRASPLHAESGWSSPKRSWYRRGRLVAGLAASALALLAVGLLAGRSGEAGATVSQDVVAVFPFSYQGGGGFEYLSEGMVNLLGASLDGAGELQSVDGRSLLSFLEASSGVPLDPDAAAAVARRFGAGSFVLGAVTELNGELRVEAVLHGRERFGLGAPAQAVVTGRSEEVLALVDRLAARLLGLGSGTRVGRRASRATENIEALKDFLRGEKASRAGRFDEAVEDYQEAVRQDSSFALANYRLSTAAYAGGRSGIPVTAAKAALRHANRLSRDDSLLVTAWLYHMNAAVDSAEHYYRAVVATRPSHAEAWEQLGELLFHWGPSVGRSPLAAREAFERVVALEPSRIEAIVHLARLAAREGKTAKLDSLVAQAHSYQATGPWALELEALRAFLSGDRGREERAIRAIAAAPVRARGVLTSLASNSYNLDGAVRLARYLLSSDLPGAERAKIELILAQLLAARGHFREAEAALEVSDLLPPARVIEYRAMLASLPDAPHSMEDRDNLWRAVHELAPGEPLPAESDLVWWRSAEYPPVLWPGLYEPRRLYLEGMLSIRLGDLATTARASDSLEARGEGEKGLLSRWAALLRAEAARRTGELERALAILKQLPLPARETYEHLLDYPRSYERYLRGMVHEDLGHAAEALRWYSTFPDPTGHDLPLLAPSHLARARIYDLLGNREAAAYHFGRFVQLQADADSELQPMVRHARARLEALR